MPVQVLVLVHACTCMLVFVCVAFKQARIFPEEQTHKHRRHEHARKLTHTHTHARAHTKTTHNTHNITRARAHTQTTHNTQTHRHKNTQTHLCHRFGSVLRHHHSLLDFLGDLFKSKTYKIHTDKQTNRQLGIKSECDYEVYFQLFEYVCVHSFVRACVMYWFAFQRRPQSFPFLFSSSSNTRARAGTHI